MRHPTRWIVGAVALVVVVFGVVLALNVGNDPEADAHSSPLLDKVAPAFDLPTLDDTRVTDADLQGKYTLVNFWNTWCGPCIDELPALKEFHDAHQDDTDVQMVGVVRDPNESKSVITSYAKANGMDWTLAMDPGNKAALDFANVWAARIVPRGPERCGARVLLRPGHRAVAGPRARRDRTPGMTSAAPGERREEVAPLDRARRGRGRRVGDRRLAER